MEFIIRILLVFLLVFLNGFFVASEFALVAIRKTRIQELVKRGNGAAKQVEKSLNDLDSYISATQLGITIASLALGWIGEPAIAHVIEPLFSFLPKSASVYSSHAVSVAIAFTIITILHIVLGELVPKSIALQRAETTALFIIRPLHFLKTIFMPFIWVLNGAGQIILRAFGLTAPAGHQLVHSEEEIKLILAQSGQEGAIDKDEVEMMINVFRLGDIRVQQIMLPRPDIFAFSVNTSIKEIIKKIENNVFSRFPVYENTIDTIIGFIHIRDIYKQARIGDETTKLLQTKIIRDILTVPEVKRADETLLEMRRKHTHMAVVNDEFGNTAGIITLEDIIESLIGEIQDEFDKPLHDFQKVDKNTYIVDGLAGIDAVQKKFNLPLKGMGYTTIGGLVFGLLGRQPKVNDKVQLGGTVLEVKALERRRIKRLLIKRDQRLKS
jgi:putative hemolysin